MSSRAPPESELGHRSPSAERQKWHERQVEHEVCEALAGIPAAQMGSREDAQSAARAALELVRG